MHFPLITVILPVYCNETSLKELYRELKIALQHLNHEIIFVNDASPDRSGEIINEFSVSDPQVRPIHLEFNQGQNRAVFQGLIQSRGSIALIMDADLQDPPELILQLIAKLEQGYDAVFAGRRGRYESPIRRMTSKVFKHILHLLCKVPKDAGLFVVMTRKTIDAVTAIPMSQPFIVPMIGLTGVKMCSIPFIRNKQAEGRSSYVFPMRLKIGFAALFQTLSILLQRRTRRHMIKDKHCIEVHNQQQIDYFEKNHKKTMQPRTSFYIDRQVDRIIQEGRLSTNERLIDIGCGIGKYTLNLARRGYQIDGLDIAPCLLEQFRQHDQGEKPIPLYCADIIDPPQKLLGTYDVAVGFFALHHMFDLEKTFEGIAKLLKPGGRILFLEPNPYNILYYIQILITPRMTWQGDKGMLNMRRKTIFSAMEKANLHNFQLKRFGFFPPFIAERKGAQKVEDFLEKASLWKSFLPFQIFMGEKR